MASADKNDLAEYCLDTARRAKRAAADLMRVNGGQKNDWLRRAARMLRERMDELEAANQQDLDAAPGYGVTDAQIDRLRLTAEHAKLQVEQAKYELETSQLALRVQENQVQQASRQVERRKILAPVSGRVVQIFRQPGEWVEPGQAIARVLRIDRLKAVGALDGGRLGSDPTGRAVTLRVDLPQRGPVEFRGRVTFVHSEANPVNGQLDFWAEIENPDLQLRPGLRASLKILDEPAAR